MPFENIKTPKRKYSLSNEFTVAKKLQKIGNLGTLPSNGLKVIHTNIGDIKIKTGNNGIELPAGEYKIAVNRDTGETQIYDSQNKIVANGKTINGEFVFQNNP